MPPPCAFFARARAIHGSTRRRRRRQMCAGVCECLCDLNALNVHIVLLDGVVDLIERRRVWCFVCPAACIVATAKADVNDDDDDDADDDATTCEILRIQV